MKKIKNISFLLCMALVVMLMSSCTRTDYTHAIPADAAAVVSINLRSIVEKSGINDDSNASLKQHLTDALKNGLNSETAKQLSEIMEDPSESGFDFSSPVYVYTAKEFGFSPVVDLNVDSKSDLTSTVEALAKSQLCTPLEKAKNFKFTILGGKVVLAFNRGTALCVESKEGMSDKLFTALDKVMTLKKEDSFCADDAFDRLKDEKGDIAFYITPSQGLSGITAATPDKDASGKAFIGNFSFDNGLIAMNLAKYFKDKPAASSSMGQTLGTSLFSRFPKAMPVMFSLGMKGAETYSELSSLLGLETLEIPLLRKLVESMQGDLAIGYNGYDKQNMSFLAFAQIKDPKLVTGLDIKSLADQFGKIQKKGANDFVYSFGKENIYYGILPGNILYVTNNASVIHYHPTADNYGQNAYASQAKGKSLFFMFDTSNIVPALQKQLGGPLVASALQKYVACVKGYNVTSDTWRFEMQWKDKNTNALKQIINIARQMAGL